MSCASPASSFFPRTPRSKMCSTNSFKNHLDSLPIVDAAERVGGLHHDRRTCVGHFSSRAIMKFSRDFSALRGQRASWRPSSAQAFRGPGRASRAADFGRRRDDAPEIHWVPIGRVAPGKRPLICSRRITEAASRGRSRTPSSSELISDFTEIILALLQGAPRSRR